MKILITDGLAKQGLELLMAAEGVEVDERKGVSPEELVDIIKDYDGLVVRSATKVTREVIEASGGRLRIIGRAGIGIDNIDLDAATKNGVAVMNTPESNSVTHGRTHNHSSALPREKDSPSPFLDKVGQVGEKQVQGSRGLREDYRPCGTWKHRKTGSRAGDGS